MNVLKLNLCNSILYKIDGEKAENKAEELRCFELDPLEAQSIEPQADKLLGNLLFHGRASGLNREGMEADEREMPAGRYLFVQTRENAARDYWLLMAIEAQKTGLWERLHLENRLFVRTLFEDGKKVTQIFRPYSL
ncbi:MAG: hypothetical protein LBG05_07790 [Treponema sp.]|jgi:hypothetical protein|nr:hypothetical protein [Treponema sp.]